MATDQPIDFFGTSIALSRHMSQGVYKLQLRQTSNLSNASFFCEGDFARRSPRSAVAHD